MQAKRGQLWAVLTIDTEADNAWEDHLNASVSNVQALRELATLLRRYGAKATCLVSYRVIDDAQAVSILGELFDEGLIEVGAHLHPWENPPFLEDEQDRRYHTYPHELPLELFRKKLEVLTERITEEFGAPMSYRAGRWGLAAAHVRVLEDLGYEVDTSVTPLITWQRKPGLPLRLGGGGGCDYRRAPLEPYWMSWQDITRSGHSGLVELPVSVQFTRAMPTSIARLYGWLPEWARRPLRKGHLIKPVWAFAAEEPNDRMEQMLESYAASSLSYFNMAFHSSEIMLGTSPRSRTPERLGQTMRNIEMTLAKLASTGRCRFDTLIEAARDWKRSALGASLPAGAPSPAGTSTSIAAAPMTVAATAAPAKAVAAEKPAPAESTR